MKIGVYAKSVKDKKHGEAVLRLIDLLTIHEHRIWTTPHIEDFVRMHNSTVELTVFDSFDINYAPIDVIFSIGGDGTILETLQIIKNSGIPVLSINTGRLGFLAGFTEEKMEKALLELEKGNYTVEKRSLLHLDSSNDIFEFNYALNDFVIHKKETSSMIIVHAYINGEFLNSYWSDGLIIATPTGSTGYSLSCGGPIIFPKSDSFVITPIAPHNLNVRPVIIPDNSVISFEIEGRASSYLASLDSRSESITDEVSMAVKRADFELNLIRLNEINFLETLRGKLNWGFDKRSTN